MKKFISLLLTLILCLSLTAPAITYAATVKLNKSKLELAVGDAYSLKLNGASGNITWTSSKNSVATVNSKGKVTAVKEGKATITASVKEKKYKCIVTVNNPVISITISDMIISDEEIASFLSDIKFKKVTPNKDAYSSTYTMTKSQQSEILSYLKEYFIKALNSDDIPAYYKSITTNDDFTSFDVFVEYSGYEEKESDDMTLLGVLMLSGFYQQVAGISDDDMECIIHIFDQKSKAEIDIIDSKSFK